MAVDTECYNYRLRLGLPELTQPFFGSWLSPDSPAPPPSFFFDSLPPLHSPTPPFSPSPASSPSPVLPPVPPHSSSHGSYAPLATESLCFRVEEEHKVDSSDDCENDKGESEEECRSGIELSNLWLDAGNFSEDQPRQQDWEVTHVREEMLGARSSAAISGKNESRSRSRDLIPSYSSAEKGESRPAHFIFDSIQESDLVRAALRALQGVPTAVSWLEQLAADFSSIAADRSSEKFTTLWTRSSSSCSLSKVLTEFAKAGRFACQLDYFTSFFLNQQTDSPVDGTSGARNSRVGDSGRKKRKRQNFMTERISERQLETSSEIWGDLGGPTISPQCHTNQAFALAVRTFMLGNLASLDKIRSSVSNRRRIALGGRSVQLSEFANGEAGLVFGFGCGDVTLLELFLHSHKQREQLQALAAVCKIGEGYSLGWPHENNSVESTGLRISTEDVDTAGSPFGMETHLFSASRNAFKEFPRGADLLSYLFDNLSVADSLHLELIRFLFDRACQPYMVFIRSWLYLAIVKDPFGEFFVKEVPLSNLKMRPGKTTEQNAMISYEIPEGVTVPCFLEEVCTPLLRAGQQLQVLSKLLDTPSTKMVDSPFKASGNVQDTQLSLSRWADILINKNTLSTRIDTQGDEQQFKRSSQMFKVFQDYSLAGLTQSPLLQQETGVVAGAAGRTKRSEMKTWTTKAIQEANAKSHQDTMARAAVLRAEDVDEVSVAAPADQVGPPSLALQSPTSEDGSKRLHVGLCLKPRLPSQVPLLNSESDTSFISDFQRGSSWPVLGLPKNPFLSYTDEFQGGHSFSYTCTEFPESNGCWDVNIHWKDPHSVPGAGAHSLMAFDDSPTTESTSESRSVADDQKAGSEQPVWLDNLEDYMRRQLTAGLDERILEASCGSFEYQFEGDDDCQSTYGLGFQPWDCSMQKAGALQRNEGRRLQVNSLHLADWEFVDTCMLDRFERQYSDDSRSLQRKEEAGMESQLPTVVDEADVESNRLSRAHLLEVGGKESPTPLKGEVWDSLLQSGSGLPDLTAPNHQGLAANCGSSSEVGKSGPGACFVGTGNRWATYLLSEYRQIVDVGCLQPTPAREDDEEDDDEIPLSVAIKLWIDEEILYQYKRTSMLTIRLLQESLHLQHHFAALRRYYFMERGDWAEYFLSALCKYDWNRLGGEPQLLEVQSMLGIALQNSSCEGDEFAERLHVVQSSGSDGYHSGLGNFVAVASSDQQHSAATFVDCNKLEAFDFIKVGYKVEWPLCLIITPNAVSRYGSIFTFLLRLKLTINALADVWRSLQVMGYSLNKGRRSSDYQKQNKKFRTLQHFRQQIGHVVTTLQRYTESQILHAVWSKFLFSVENEVNDIQDLERVHSIYLDDAYHQCFLSSEMEDPKSCIDVIMQCTLDFRNTLVGANPERSRDLVPFDDQAFDKVLEVKAVFEEHLQKMYSFRHRPEPQYSVLLSDFWMCLNYNGCLEPPQHPEG